MKVEAGISDQVHQLVLTHGRERARELVSAKQRPLIDIAAEVLADESQSIGITYAGFCLTSLPHKRLPDDQAWTKQGHKVTLMVEPGRMMVRKRTVLYRCPVRCPRPDDSAVSARPGCPHG